MLLPKNLIHQDRITIITLLIVFFLTSCRQVDLCSSKIGNNRTNIESFPVDINDLKDSVGQTKIYTLNKDTGIAIYRTDDTSSANMYINSYLALGRNRINIDSIIAKYSTSAEENKWVDFANYNIKSKVLFSDSALVLYAIFGFESHNTVSLTQKFKPYILLFQAGTCQVVFLEGYTYNGHCGDFVIAKNNVYDVLTFDEKENHIYVYTISNKNAVLTKKLNMKVSIDEDAILLSKKNYLRLTRILMPE